MHYSQCCALCINMAQFCSIYIMHQYGSVLCIRHQLWLNHVHHGSLNAVHPRLIDVHQTSVWFNAVHQISIIAQCCVPGTWLCITHQYGSMLCNHVSMMCIRHHYGLKLCIKHHYCSICRGVTSIEAEEAVASSLFGLNQTWMQHWSSCLTSSSSSTTDLMAMRTHVLA